MLVTARKYMGTNKPLFIWTLVFFVLANIVEFVEPYVFGQMLNTVQIGQKDARTSVVWLLVIL